MTRRPGGLLARVRGLRPSLQPGETRSVFFNLAWFWLAGGLFLIGIVSGHPGMSLLGALVLVMAAVGWTWNRYSLHGITYERAVSANRAIVGDEVTLSLTVTNRKPLPLPWFALDETIGDALAVLDRDVIPSGVSGQQLMRITTGLRAYERVTWRVRLACTARGYHAIGPTTLRSGDLFGFFTNRASVAAETHVLVYPQVVDLPDLGLPAKDVLGEVRSQRNLFTDPARVVGVRDYRPEDPFRTIHWKATARQGRLQVRVAEPMTSLRLGIFLNLDTFEHYWEGLDLALSERAIVAAASLAAWADRTEYAVGVYANGNLARSDQPLRIPPGRGAGQLQRLLEGLAKVSPYSTMPFPKLLTNEFPAFPFGATLVVVTARMAEALVGVLLHLLDAGHRVVLVPLGECAVPPLPGLIVRRVDEANLGPELSAHARRRTGTKPPPEADAA